MTVIKGSIFRTEDRVSSVSSKDKRILAVRLNKNNRIVKIMAKGSGTGSVIFNMENGHTYTVTFVVEKPKAQKEAKRISLSSENMVSLDVYDLFGTSIDMGIMKAQSKNHPDKAYIKENKLFIVPKSKDKIKVTYKYLDKEYKMKINVQ